MKVLFFCPRWGSESLSWNEFFFKVKSAGYNGVETGFPFTLSEEEQKEMTDGLQQHKLMVIGQHWQTIENDFDEHLKIFMQHLYSLIKLNPLFINSQTGKDFFSIEQNLTLITEADKISRETGVKVVHETHRGKWSFAAHITKQYLQQAPHIKITLDISHWYNVAESFLEDQEEAVQLAIHHADHLHARIGFTEGPQVIDPRAPENKTILEIHLKCWDKLIELKRENGAEIFTITPEFGAPPYQHLMPFTNQPITNLWDVNVWMKNLLDKRYNG